MKKFIIVLFLFATSSALAEPVVLVEFSNGNQIFGSTLAILSDGTITHGERTCCPPRTVTTQDPSLTSKELTDLKREVAACASGKVIVQAGAPTTEGSQSGALVAYEDGKKVVIHQIDRNRIVMEADQVFYSAAPEAVAIEKLVNGFVKYPLYLVK